MLNTLRRELNDLGWIIRTLGLVAVGAALYRELRMPPEERTWHGRLLGFVPYDFRIPTPRRLVDAWWNGGSDRILSDQPFGVGWAVNLPALIGRVQRLLGATPSRRRTRSKA